jgi:quercetin dioxygenase-like cupin family protein
MEPVVLTAEQIRSLPWESIHGFEQVTEQVLWRMNESCAGIMRIPADGEVPMHAHRESHHHIWVIDGTCTVLDSKVGAGAYVHVPAGVDHEILPGEQGCTIFYLYLRA